MLTIERTSEDGHDVVVARGELDLTNVHEIDQALVGTMAPTLILDLGGLAFVDSAGLRAIDQANRRLAADGRVLIVVAPEGSRAAWTFRVAGFANGLLVESVEAAQSQVAR